MKALDFLFASQAAQQAQASQQATQAQARQGGQAGPGATSHYLYRHVHSPLTLPEPPRIFSSLIRRQAQPRTPPHPPLFQQALAFGQPAPAQQARSLGQPAAQQGRAFAQPGLGQQARPLVQTQASQTSRPLFQPQGSVRGGPLANAGMPATGALPFGLNRGSAFTGSTSSHSARGNGGAGSGSSSNPFGQAAITASRTDPGHEAPNETGDSSNPSGEARSKEQSPALLFRTLPRRPQPPATQVLARSGVQEAAALFVRQRPGPPPAQELLKALAATLLGAARQRMATPQQGRASHTVVVAAATQSFLSTQTSMPTGPLTLSEVKSLLMSEAPQPGLLPMSHDRRLQQDAMLLLPLHLLNATRPRTPGQRALAHQRLQGLRQAMGS